MDERDYKAMNSEIKHVKITAKQLSKVNSLAREMIQLHLLTENITLAKFSRDAGLSQNQIWLYLNAENTSKGLHTTTLEKIGKYLLDYENRNI